MLVQPRHFSDEVPTLEMASGPMGEPGALRAAMLSALETYGACRVLGVPATEAQILDVARPLGTLDLGIPEALSGPPVMALRHDPIKSAQAERPAYFTSGAFALHTDLTYADRPPRWLLTLCVSPDRGGGGETLLSDCRAAWNRLLASDRRALDEPVFSFRNAPRTGPGICAHRAIHESRKGRECWRFREDTLVVPAEYEEPVARFARELAGGQLRFVLDCGDLLVVDNHRMAHGRAAFEPAGGRHILRAYAQDGSA